ncbi:MAG: DUF6183 family protein [Myxococcota bacterium]
MEKSIEILVRDLRGVSDVNAHYRAIDNLVARGEVEQVVAFARAVEEQPNIGAESWALEAVFDRVVRALAFRDTVDAAAAAIDLGLSSRKKSTQSARSKLTVSRELAYMLATGQSKATLLTLLKRLEYNSELEDVLACWTQELVVRGVDISGEPSVNTLWGRLSETQHPLAALPLHLATIERGLRKCLPQEGLGGSSYGLPYGPSERVDAESTQALPFIEHVVAADIPPRLGAASVVANWQEESNGRSETKTFRFDRPIAPRTLTARFLKNLPLLCLDGTDAEQVTVRALPAEQALCMLFSAAANGGAYNRGRRAAYGRLELWQTVRAWVGDPAPYIDRLAEKAAQWAWYAFDAPSAWFEQVAWDLGIAALSPDGMELSVLAATDTD